VQFLVSVADPNNNQALGSNGLYRSSQTALMAGGFVLVHDLLVGNTINDA
jgi:hypothetical protein